MSADAPRMDDGLRMRLEIHPQPNADETAAIVTAMKILKSRESVETVSNVSGWRLAARREAIHADLSAASDGWRMAARLER